MTIFKSVGIGDGHTFFFSKRRLKVCSGIVTKIRTSNSTEPDYYSLKI